MKAKFPSWLLPLASWVPLASAFPREKFRLWFHTHEYHWSKIAESQCSAEIRDYRDDNREKHSSPCATVLDCLLNNTTESIKLNLASSQVLMGIAPSMLSYLGSDLAELAVLSTHRPLLVMLMSVSAPSQQVRNLFTPMHVAGVRDRTPSRAVRAYYDWLRSLPEGWQTLATCFMYGVVGAAFANSIYTSIYLDARTVVGFRCGAIYMPLMWPLLGMFPTLFAMWAVRQQYSLPSLLDLIPFIEYMPGHIRNKDSDLSYRAACLAQEPNDSSRKWLSELLFSVASLVGLVQLVYGTAILSTLVPVSFLDAIPLVLRYALSNVLCRAVLLVELDGIRIRMQDSQPSSIK